MNPVDHPHGGGEGKAPIGMPRPVTPWGKPTLGYRTRKKNKKSDDVHRQAAAQVGRRGGGWPWAGLARRGRTLTRVC